MMHPNRVDAMKALIDESLRLIGSTRLVSRLNDPDTYQLGSVFMSPGTQTVRNATQDVWEITVALPMRGGREQPDDVSVRRVSSIGSDVHAASRFVQEFVKQTLEADLPYASMEV